MSKKIGATQGKAPPEVKTKKKRKSLPGEEKQNSSAKETSPLKEQEAAAASEEGSEDSGAINLPVEILKPKKVLKFRNYFPERGRSFRPGADFSEDDDDDSIELKEQEIELVKLKNASYYEQMSGDDEHPDEDCPFWSNLIWPNCQLLNFGLARDMHPNFFHEAARRICIFRNYMIDCHQELIDVEILGDNESRSKTIPAIDATLQEIISAGWTISEHRKIIRRLTRDVARMAFEDCSARSSLTLNREIIDRCDYHKVMKFEELSKLTAEQLAEEDSDDEENFVEDKLRFCSEDSRFDGKEAPIFFKCCAAFQENMPNTMEEIFEVFEQSKKRKLDIDKLDKELAECQEDLLQSEADLEEARVRNWDEERALQTVQEEGSEAKRVLEIELLDKKMRLEEMRLEVAQAELLVLKTQSEGGGGSGEKLLRGVDPELHLLTTSKEDDYFVKAARN